MPKKSKKKGGGIMHFSFATHVIHKSLRVRPQAGSAVTNGREPKSCLGQVFNSRLGHIAALLSKC